MCFFFVFFFKQKTAYEMRISDWSSDVCSSDLEQGVIQVIDRDGAVIPGVEPRRYAHLPLVVGSDAPAHAAMLIAVMNSEPELRERVTAAVRVGGRRWNIQIEGRIDVRLPEDRKSTRLNSSH